MIEAKTLLMRLAILADAILYTVFKRVIGLQFLTDSLSLSGLGIQIITPSLCVLEREPFLNPSFNALRTKPPNLSQKHLKNFIKHCIQNVWLRISLFLI